MPSTPKGKHSAGAGKPSGSTSQGSFAIVGKIGKRLLGKLTGWDNPRER
jgi:hypothetical protein